MIKLQIIKSTCIQFHSIQFKKNFTYMKHAYKHTRTHNKSSQFYSKFQKNLYFIETRVRKMEYF